MGSMHPVFAAAFSPALHKVFACAEWVSGSDGQRLREKQRGFGKGRLTA